jgi:hypothetical protein
MTLSLVTFLQFSFVANYCEIQLVSIFLVFLYASDSFEIKKSTGARISTAKIFKERQKSE